MSTPAEVLKVALSEWQTARNALETYKVKAQTVERDAQASIDDCDTTEGSAAIKLAHSQVLLARVKSREIEYQRHERGLILQTCIASQELNRAVRMAWLGRREIIVTRGSLALEVPRDILDRGDLDIVLESSEPLQAVKALEVAIYKAQYIETVTQQAEEFYTVNDGDKEVRQVVTTDRRPVAHQSLDIEHLVGSVDRILGNWAALAEEVEREI